MEKQQLAEDMNFIRSTLERTHRSFDPGVSEMITWGIVCAIMYPAIQILATMGIYRLIWPVAFIAVGVGGGLNCYFGYRLSKREKMAGFVPHIGKQINRIWWVLVVNGLIWTFLAIYKHWTPYSLGFIWACVYATALSVMGILYSKKWLIGGITVYFAMVVGIFMFEYAYYILRPVMGLACIVPSVIAWRRLKTLEKSDGKE